MAHNRIATHARALGMGASIISAAAIIGAATAHADTDSAALDPSVLNAIPVIPTDPNLDLSVSYDGHQRLLSLAQRCGKASAQRCSVVRLSVSLNVMGCGCRRVVLVVFLMTWIIRL